MTNVSMEDDSGQRATTLMEEVTKEELQQMNRKCHSTHPFFVMTPTHNIKEFLFDHHNNRIKKGKF